MKSLLVLCLVLQVVYVSSVWYIPGAYPQHFITDQQVQLKVDKLTSEHTQIPLSYYELPYCAPADKDVADPDNLGEMLTGELKLPTDYNLFMKKDDRCVVLCTKTLTKKDIADFRLRIQEDYKANWLIDNLPAATLKGSERIGNENLEVYESGFSIGKKDKSGDIYLFNHVDIRIKYHPIEQPDTDSTKKTVVGFKVAPSSIAYTNTNDSASIETQCKEVVSSGFLYLPENAESLTVAFTYSVWWENSNIPWASRWDIYLKMTDNQIHWFAIINSIIVVLFLTIMVAMILARALHKDFLNLREMQDKEEIGEEFGWKMVHGDVFRPPINPALLAVSIGTGVQYLSITVVVMAFALVGLLSPDNRGVLLESFLYLLVVMSCICGYFSARNYKLYNGTNWKKLILLALFLYPGFLGAIFIVLNIILWEEHGTSEVKIATLLEMSFWFLLTIPLSLAGTFFAYKKPKTEVPLKVHQIPRQIPEQEWYLKPIVSIFIGGILPFGAIFIELYFIMSSIWLHLFYYLFGFLFLVLIFLVVTCAEISIVMCYFQLCSEDYNWWWRSFLTSGAPAFYMFLYSVFYYFSRLSIIGFASGLLYFGYTLMMCTFFFLLTGAIGYYACLWFVIKIYSEKFE